MIDHAIFTFLLVLARVSALLAVFPLFARQQVPFSIKAGLAVSLTWFWFGALPQETLLPLDRSLYDSTGAATLLLVREILCGLILGMIAGWILIPARIAGVYIGQELGLTMGQVLDPTGADSGSEVGRLFETVAVLLFFSLNFHHWLLLALHHSFSFVNRQSGILDFPAGVLADLVNQLDEFGLLVAAPVAIALAVINFGLLYLNRASSTLNFFTVGSPVRLLSGIGILLLFWPLIVRNIAYSFERVEQSLQGVFTAFAA